MIELPVFTPVMFTRTNELEFGDVATRVLKGFATRRHVPYQLFSTFLRIDPWT